MKRDETGRSRTQTRKGKKSVRRRRRAGNPSKLPLLE